MLFILTIVILYDTGCAGNFATILRSSIFIETLS